MAYTAFTPGQMTRTAMLLQPRAGLIAAIALLFFAAAFWQGDDPMALAFWLTGGTLLALVGVTLILAWGFRRRSRRVQVMISEFVARDATPCFVTDDEGELWYVNAAAKARFDGDTLTLSSLLGGLVPNPQSVMLRLRRKAEGAGGAREDIVTRAGSVRLSATRLSGGDFLWRLEDLNLRDDGPGAEATVFPVVAVGRNGTVLHMNEPARRLVGERVKSIERLFEVLPPRPGAINRVLGFGGALPCFLVERPLAGGRRELTLIPAAESGEETGEGPGEGAGEGAGAEPGVGGWAVVEALPVPLLKLTPEGEVLRSNRLARDLLGKEKCEGVHIATLMEGLGRSLGDWLSEVATGREINSSEFLRVARDDREVFVQVMLKRASDPGDPTLVAVLNDATELKTLEAQFVQSQKMQAIGQLAGGVAHDFNNLLTAISGHCDLLLLRHDQGDPEYNDLVQINQNANRAAALVNQLLAFSRKQTQRLEVLDLRDTLSDLAHLLNRLVGEKVRLSLHHDPRLHPLRADKRQLEQVVMNLVVNARDAMPEGGEIRIETRNLRYDAPMQRDRATVPAGDYVAVDIQDAGVGIPADKLQKIFEPFYTTKRTGEGTGLGLSTAYGIVKQTGGFIFAESAPGSGTCFTLLFPAHLADQDAEEESAVAVAAGSSDLPAAESDEAETNAVILLVEDEAPVRAFASRALRLRGYVVLEAASAEKALETLDETDLKIDIFVTDVVMPGMDGPSWVRRAQETHPDVRVVFMSGYAEDAFGEGHEEVPNSVFLPKPFSLTELTDTISAQLR